MRGPSRGRTSLRHVPQATSYSSYISSTCHVHLVRLHLIPHHACVHVTRGTADNVTPRSSTRVHDRRLWYRFYSLQLQQIYSLQSVSLSEDILRDPDLRGNTLEGRDRDSTQSTSLRMHVDGKPFLIRSFWPVWQGVIANLLTPALLFARHNGLLSFHRPSFLV